MSDEVPASLPRDVESQQRPSDEAASSSLRDFEQVDAPKSNRIASRSRRRWRWSHDWPIVTLIGAVVLGWVLYALVWPPIEIRHKIATAKWKYSPNDLEISLPIRIMLRTCEYWFVFWFFYLGASIGSFINVVANRTPQGKTIVSRGSHCPYCDQPLHMLDNSPLFGWVALRGQCRTCHLPISPRYVTMEIVVGLMFMILAIVELMGNGMNLPHRDWKHGSGIVSTVFYPKWDLIGAYVAHCSLFATAVMLIGSHRDRLRFPVLPLAILGSIYLASVTFNPVLSPVKWTEPFGQGFPSYARDSWSALVTGMIGGATGLGFGSIAALGLWGLFRSRNPENASKSLATWCIHYTSLTILSGVLLGWQASITVVSLSWIATAIAIWILPVARWTWLSRDTILRPQVLALAIWTSTLFLHHCMWRQVAHVLHIG